jgi:hypothetical protein
MLVIIVLITIYSYYSILNLFCFKIKIQINLMEKIDSLNQVAEFHRTFNAPILENHRFLLKKDAN